MTASNRLALTGHAYKGQSQCWFGPAQQDIQLDRGLSHATATRSWFLGMKHVASIITNL